MKIEFDKIITNAVSAVVVATFLGAAAIVWKGATSVDDKVQQTRGDMVHLIDSLSDKLAGYEVQLTSISNQLSAIQRNQSIPAMVGAPAPSPTRVPSPTMGSPWEQRALKANIAEQLAPKK